MALFNNIISSGGNVIVQLASLAAAVTFGVLLFRSVTSYLRLRQVPGPFLAAWTNFPRVSWVLSKRAHEIHIGLHEKYGDLVRFGPNMVSVSDPREIPTLYPMRAGFVKSDFYKVLLPYTAGKSLPSLFGTSEEEIHKALKKPIAPIFAQTNVIGFEKYVDDTISVLFKQLDRRFVEPGKVCDLGQWLQMFAFDFMAEITFSKRFGFLENGGDPDNVMENIWKHFKAAAPVSQMPWVDRFWNKNPYLNKIWPTTSSPIMGFAMEKAKERQAFEKAWDTYDAEAPEVNTRDMLSRFVEAQANDPNCPDWGVAVWTFSNVTAGSDSTAVVLRTIFRNLLQYPQTLQRLKQELKEATERGQLSNGSRPCAWNEVRNLPYLDACIKEAVRMHPPFGLPLERVVPPGGVTICGQSFEEGTVVGMSAWVANRHKLTFGEDAGDWRPERWLCGEARRRAMEAAILTFGAGKRVCLGKHIAFLEMYKLVPTIFQTYDIEPVNPEEWAIENCWFVKQRGLSAKLTRKDK